MRFINPKTDFAFKKIFGSVESKEILLSFLNAILQPEAEEKIVDLVILDPYNAPRIRGMKDTYLDVNVTTNNGKHVIIEMQVLPVDGFEKRILYNAAKKYSSQLKKGKKFTGLIPVIALTITDFVMFGEFSDFISKFVLKEQKHLTDFISSDIELVFVELPKFKKSEQELESMLDKWLFFMKNAEDLEFVPSKLSVEKQILQAFEIANEAQLSEDELEIQEKKEVFILDQLGVKTRAEREGFNQGHERGFNKGLEKGLQEGLERGKVEIVKSLLAFGMPVAEISKITKLTEQEITKLKV